jgi:hypothetical protein
MRLRNIDSRGERLRGPLAAQLGRPLLSVGEWIVLWPCVPHEAIRQRLAPDQALTREPGASPLG